MSSIGVTDVDQDNSIDNDYSSSSVSPVTPSEDDDFDDFADFQEASPLVNDYKINPPSDDDIQETPLPNESNNEPKKFDSSSPSSSITSSNGKKIASNQSNVKPFPSLDNIVNQSFTKAIQDDYVETEQKITSHLFNDKSSQSYRMWENLLNPEESTSFRLNWESSHTFQVFLRSLKIDNKNVDDFFVTFESSSESDEPTMNSPVSATSQSSDNQIIPKISNTEMISQTSSSSSSLPSSSVILSTTNSTSTLSPIVSNSTESMSQKQEPSAASSKTENTNSSASLSSLSSSSSSSSSSSTKPNTESNDSTNQSDEIQPSTSNNQLSNNLLDVTFFLNNPDFMQPCSSPKAAVKVNESEQSTQNNESSTKPLSIISSSLTDPFHNLISHIQDASSTKSTLTSSESTNRIFEELPLLSFMRTKLLMFPMRDSIKD